MNSRIFSTSLFCAALLCGCAPLQTGAHPQTAQQDAIPASPAGPPPNEPVGFSYSQIPLNPTPPAGQN